MKCTKKGFMIKDQIWVGACSMCGAEFEATKGDLLINFNVNNGGHSLIVDCTECYDRMSVTMY